MDTRDAATEQTFTVGQRVWWKPREREYAAVVVKNANNRFLRVDLGRNPLDGRRILRSASVRHLRPREE